MFNEDTVILEVEVTQETMQELKALMDEHLWEPDEGLRMILGAGLGALTAERVREAYTDQEKIIQLSQRLARAEGRLVTTRFDLSEVRQDIKRWELSTGAVREMAAGSEKVIRRQNSEIDEMKDLILKQQAEIKHLQAQLGAEQADQKGQPAYQEVILPAKKSWRLKGKG